MRIALFLLVLAEGLFLSAHAQNDTVNPAGLYYRARKHALEGEYELGHRLCVKILNSDPHHHDARVLIARMHMWAGEYVDARKALVTTLNMAPEYKPALLAMADLESWSGNREKALKYLQKGRASYPEDSVFRKRMHHLQKAAENQNEPAKRAGAPGTGSFPNRLGFRTYYAFHREPGLYRRINTGIEYQRKTDAGVFIGRINFADMVLKTETVLETQVSRQYQVTAYPFFGENSYGYLDYGYARDVMFPSHRAGAEYYQGLPAGFEISAGMRYLDFNNGKTRSRAVSYTAYLGKYYHNYWFAFRPFFTNLSSGSTKSYNIEIRRYFAKGQNYFTIIAGTGFVPDNPLNHDPGVSYPDLQKKHIAAGFKGFIVHRIGLHLLLEYRREQYRQQSLRNGFRIKMDMAYAF